MNQKKQLQSTTEYPDIYDLPHPTSKTHPRMSLEDRAAQFSPFAALTGFEDAIERKEEDTLFEREAGGVYRTIFEED